MALEEYRRKRDFKKTPEPAGAPASAAGPDGRPSFVVQKHAARRLHYDFRLELGGVLKSWAVPKGPSVDPDDRRLAVHVEDHPIEYGGFEGIIPKGEYGGGTVMLWDRGWWEEEGDPVRDYAKGHLRFVLHGDKLKGAWSLVRLGRKDGERTEGWYLIKRRDDHAVPGRGTALVDDADRSVATGRAMDEIAAAADRVWSSSAGELTPPPAAAPVPVRAEPASRKPAARIADRVAGARKAAMPEVAAPALASAVERPPAGDDWLHEIKLDGYRLLAHVAGGRAVLRTRKGLDWTARFPTLAAALGALPVRQAVLDGEVVHLLPSGVSSFAALQADLSRKDDGPLIYMAFDLLHLDGWDLTAARLDDRKAALEALLARAQGDASEGAPAARLRYSEHQVGHGPEFLRAACGFALEGIVSKRRDARYPAGRGSAWLKIKCGAREELVIVGFTDPAGARAGFGALLVGYHRPDGALVYAGKVGTGYSDALLTSLRHTLGGLERTAPTVTLPKGLSRRGVHWVEPRLVAEVAFGEWTTDGLLRHPSFIALREDKPAEEVVLEPPGGGGAVPAAAASPEGAPETPPETPVVAYSGVATVAGVRLTNAEKLLYPERGISKLALAEYYVAVADWMLPHLANRPLSLFRCPEGVGRDCFFQKNLHAGVPEAIKRIVIPGEEKTRTQLLVDDLAGLIGLVQMGAVEIHPWGSTADDIEHPDRLIFDLDPDEGLAWERVVAAALAARDLLDSLGLRSWPKTTGGKGLHLVVPIRRALDWEQAKAFSRAVVDRLVRAAPDLYTPELAKRARRGKIFIDYLRNGRGATAVAAYSSRAKPAATVSAPLSWDEVEGGIRSDHFTVANLPQRLRALGRAGDPWADLAGSRQAITAAARRKLGL